MSRPLVVAAHGTASPAGRRVVEDCAARAAAALGVEHVVGFVDVCEPALSEVLIPHSVVVPLFLASGYHVRHDVPAAAALRPGVRVTPALGAHPAVVGALADRLLDGATTTGAATTTQLRSCGGRIDGVVLASAGSTQPAARAEVERVATLLSLRVGVEVRVAYLSGPGPRIEQVCAAHHRAGRHRIAVASHLLAPGVFLDRAARLAQEAGAVAVTGELGTHPAISDLVAARYVAAVEGVAA